MKNKRETQIGIKKLDNIGGNQFNTRLRERSEMMDKFSKIYLNNCKQSVWQQ